MPSEGLGQQDQVQKSTKKPTVYPADSAESSPLSRPPTLHKQPPTPPPKPFNRLPNHIAGTLFFVHTLICMCMFLFVSLILPLPSSVRRRHPGEVAVHVVQVFSSSTSKEVPDLRTCRGHGAHSARLPEVPPSQPCSNGRALPAVRAAPPPQADHRGAQQDPGPHHAEV